MHARITWNCLEILFLGLSIFKSQNLLNSLIFVIKENSQINNMHNFDTILTESTTNEIVLLKLQK